MFVQRMQKHTILNVSV